MVDSAEQLLRSVPGMLALIGAGLLVALKIPFLDGAFQKLGLKDDASFQALVVTVVLTTLLLEVRELSRTIKGDARGPQHFTDPGAMYETLKTRADGIRKRDDRRIDVLGLTLFSAWIHLRFWLERDGCCDWSIRFATLARDATNIAGFVPDDWPDESAANCAAIRSFAAQQSTKEHRHSLEVVEYDFVPGVHGFRLGNGDLFLSCARWEDDGRLSKRFTYEFIPCNDDSVRADAYRELFDNWFTRATAGRA